MRRRTVFDERTFTCIKINPHLYMCIIYTLSFQNKYKTVRYALSAMVHMRTIHKYTHTKKKEVKKHSGTYTQSQAHTTV